MRIAYKREELTALYEQLVRNAERHFSKGNYWKSLDCIKSAADFQYKFNDRYSDKRLNLLLKKISSKLFPYNDYRPRNDIVFFFESFCADNKGLTQQYLDALVSCKKFKVVFVLECIVNESGAEIINYCKENDVIIETIKGGNWIEQAQYLYNLINDYKPSAALFHLKPQSFLPFLCFEPYKHIRKYQINLTDHAFWLGTPDFFDYTYEFRDYGAIVSHLKRGFPKEKIIINPYYPWQSNMVFQGFPVSVDNRIVVFSGGAPYKIEGDGGKYYEMVSHILNYNENVLFFYAGSGDLSRLQKFISDNHYDNRMFLLGERKDIDAVFKRCDIYLNTHPFGGGLMVQYAAINGKPILVYDAPDFDDIVCTKNKEHISFDSIGEFYKEVDKLLYDYEYRKKRGEYYRSLIAGKEDFRKRFISTFLSEDIKVTFPCRLNIDFDSFCLGYVYKINNGIFEFIENHFIKNGIYSPKVLVNFLLYLPTYIKSRCKHNKL